jgi:hypothetical protein
LFVISVIHCLSLDKTRLNVAKLNKEYEVNEGIGGGFGEFLMDLDDLTSGILGKAKSRKSLYSEKKNSKQQTKRKDEEEEDENEGEEDNEVDEEAVNEEDGDGSEAEEEDENDSVDEKEEAEEAQKDKALTPFTYKPIAGEDIYGRVVDPNSQSSSAPSKYVPPGRRNLQNSSSSSSVVTLGTLSEKDLLLKRKLRGLLNKISEQSKDSILRELKQHYEQSSHNLTNEILLDSMIEMSTTTTASKLVNLIPLYASILSSLYFHVSSDIIYYSIERIFMKILWYCQDFMEKLAGLEERRGNDQGEEKEEDFTTSHHRPVYNLLLLRVLELLLLSADPRSAGLPPPSLCFHIQQICNRQSHHNIAHFVAEHLLIVSQPFPLLLDESGNRFFDFLHSVVVTATATVHLVVNTFVKKL